MEERGNLDNRRPREEENPNDPHNGKDKLTQPTSDISQTQKESSPKILMDKEIVEIDI